MLMFVFLCVFTFCMDQKMVIQTKSVEYMPLFLSLASLVNGICWTAYALIKFDLYITVSNQPPLFPKFSFQFDSPYQQSVGRQHKHYALALALPYHYQ